MGKPWLSYGAAAKYKKGEDYYLMNTDYRRMFMFPCTSFSVFAVFDGHNGSDAATFTKEHLLDYVIDALPCKQLSTKDWLDILPRALVAGFVRTDKEFQSTTEGTKSGTTVTFVVIDDWTVTVASVGDSHCVLDPQGGGVSVLTADHRFDENAEECDRVRGSGANVIRAIFDNGEHGPLRCWPGGLSLSRSIGDADVGEFISPVPHVKQVKLSSAGGRLIIASDGVWDSLSPQNAAEWSRGMHAARAARHLVKAAARKGLHDDATCIVVDIIPSDKDMLPPPKKHSKLKALFSSKKLSSGGEVEVLFEEGSAKLAERLGSDAGVNDGKLKCVVCQADLAQMEGFSIHANSMDSIGSHPGKGPFLCGGCFKKKNAMEAKKKPKTIPSSDDEDSYSDD